MLNITGQRRFTYAASAALVLISIVFLALWQLKPGIDFVGGALLEIQSDDASALSRDALCAQLPAEICSESFIVQPSEDGKIIIRYKDADEARNTQVLDVMISIDDDVTILRTDFIGATISEQLKDNTYTAIIMAMVVILLYVAWAFRKISFPVSSWSYGFAAIVALVHDVIITLGIFSFLGHFYGVEISIAFVAALLTILGYSVNDTIVVFDRLRENILRTRDTEHFEDLVNRSLNEAMARSLNTSLTVVVVLLALLIWGSTSLTWFAVALLIGIIIGTYSSIFVATSLVVTIYRYKEKRNLLGRRDLKDAKKN